MRRTGGRLSRALRIRRATQSMREGLPGMTFRWRVPRDRLDARIDPQQLAVRTEPKLAAVAVVGDSVEPRLGGPELANAIGDRLRHGVERRGELPHFVVRSHRNACR